MIFSNVQYLPDITMPNISNVTPSDVIHSGTPKIRMAWVMPMYSVTRVSQLIRARSKIENHPQPGPKASKIASA